MVWTDWDHGTHGSLSDRYRCRSSCRFLLVLIFGSPMYVDWMCENANTDAAGGWFLSFLAWPAWDFAADNAMRDVVADSLRAILVVIATALFLGIFQGSQRGSGRVSQLFAGWAAFIFAAVVAALVASLIRSDPSLLGVLRAASNGDNYGLFVGWIVGLATRSRPRRRELRRRTGAGP